MHALHLILGILSYREKDHIMKKVIQSTGLLIYEIDTDITEILYTPQNSHSLKNHGKPLKPKLKAVYDDLGI